MEPKKAQAELEGAVVALARELPGMAPKDACARLAWLKRQAVIEGFDFAVSATLPALVTFAFSI